MGSVCHWLCGDARKNETHEIQAAIKSQPMPNCCCALYAEFTHSGVKNDS